jgi:hypothetical protein
MSRPPIYSNARYSAIAGTKWPSGSLITIYRPSTPRDCDTSSRAVQKNQ